MSSSDVASIIESARCRSNLPTGLFGLWRIERRFINDVPSRTLVGAPYQTILSRWTAATMHLTRGKIVMDDSQLELRKHLPIWLRGSGKVLVTGLGLGCVVRGLLSRSGVEQITVLEKDKTILKVVGKEFVNETRVRLIHTDAFDFDPQELRWDYAWHDIWDERENEAVLHCKLMVRFQPHVCWQGAWGMPRWWKRRAGGDFIGNGHSITGLASANHRDRGDARRRRPRQAGIVDGESGAVRSAAG